MNHVVVRIGLHKTATRYLQRAVFSRLDSDRYGSFAERLLVRRRKLTLRASRDQSRPGSLAPVSIE